MVILIIAESTFGAGWKLFAPTFAIISGLPKIWVCRLKMLWLPGSAQIFSATSFWTTRTIKEGRSSFWFLGRRKWLRIGEVM